MGKDEAEVKAVSEKEEKMNITIAVDNVNMTLEEVKRHTEVALMECGAICESYTKQDTPVDTGRLRNSFTHKMKNENTVAISSNVEYGIYQELGTSRGVKPKYMLTNGMKNHITEYGQVIKDEFSR